MTRKKFIILSSLGFFSSLIPNYFFSNSKNSILSFNANALLKQAADLRKAKKYNQAKNLYQQIINQFPNEIRAYDGLRKVMLAKGKQEFEVIKMFRKGIECKSR